MVHGLKLRSVARLVVGTAKPTLIEIDRNRGVGWCHVEEAIEAIGFLCSLRYWHTYRSHAPYTIRKIVINHEQKLSLKELVQNEPSLASVSIDLVAKSFSNKKRHICH